MISIKELLQDLGIPRTYLGFKHLSYSVLVAMENEDRLLSVTKSLYPVVAAKFQTNATCVERNLRTVIKVCWERGNRPLLNEIAGYEILQKPSTGEFISMLAVYLERRQNKKQN